jgi:hypothetical protein
MVKKILKFIGQYFYNILISIDQLVNVLMFGDPDETISSRTGRLWSGSWFEKLINIIFHFQPDHCENAIEEDEGSKDLLKPRE